MLNNKININIKLHENVKNSYQNLANVLKRERENQYTMIEELDPLWSGVAKETFEQLYTATLEEGDYETLRSKIVAIADIMDCSLVEIKRQKSICDTLYNCLAGKPTSDSEIVSGNLALDSINVVKIDSECDGIVDSCNRAKEKLEEAMSLCGNLVNFGSCADELDRAYLKVMRIKDLQDAIDEYRIAVKNIDAGLQEDYGNWKKTQLVSTITLNQETSNVSCQFTNISSADEFDSSLDAIKEKEFLDWTDDDIDTLKLACKSIIEEKNKKTLLKVFEITLAQVCNIAKYIVSGDTEKISETRAWINKVDNDYDVVPDWLEAYGNFIRYTPMMLVGFYLTRMGVFTHLFASLDFEQEDGIYHVNVNKYKVEAINNFLGDDNGVCWQQIGGYCDAYDYVFDFFCDMQANKDIQFTDDSGNTYTIWLWKGEYLNLGAGGECGIYVYNSNDENIFEKAIQKLTGGSFVEAAVNNEIPITMTIDYGDGSQTTYDAGSTWWSTSFNPDKQFVKANDITMTYTLDFSGDTDMWQNFVNGVRKLSTDIEIELDEENCIATIIF